LHTLNKLGDTKMSHSTTNMTTRELQTRMTVRFAYHSEMKSAQQFMEDRDVILAMDDNQFFNHGFYAVATAIEDALNAKFNRRWWAYNG
jgi:hypothetical protein